MAETSIDAFKAKDTRFVVDWLKSKGLHKAALYLKAFKNHLYYLLHVRVFSIKPCLHTQLPEHNRSYRKVGLGRGALGGWALGGGNLNKNFPKIQMPGGCPGGGMLKLRFDWYISLTLSLILTYSSTTGLHTYNLDDAKDRKRKCCQ